MCRRMCIFQSGQDIPPLVRLSLRTLQYLVIPLLSVAILVVGSLHWGDCGVVPLLPLWHIIAGASGLCTPIFYLLFDEINPWLSRSHPLISEVIDNVVVFILPLYLIFEIAWLITGSVWVFNTPEIENPLECDRTLYIFSYVVVLNFWIHILTPAIFMLSLCCTRIFPYCGYCTYWKIAKNAVDNWTRSLRLGIASVLSIPLGASMIIVGAISLNHCKADLTQNNVTTTSDGDNRISPNETTSQEFQDLVDSLKIPIWLLTAGSILLLVPGIYFIYDKYCKDEDGGPLIKAAAKSIVILFLLCGLAWSVVGFLWIFGSHSHAVCGADSITYQFAFSTLIILNIIMDVWICFKICVVLYWAFLSDD